MTGAACQSDRDEAVILLKEGDGSDPFADSLRGHGFGSVEMVAVLRHTFDNADRLAAIIANEQAAYAGVIVTSKRAVEAWRNAAQHRTWNVPFFAVGLATRNALVEAGLASDVVLGAAQAGTGERLAAFIVEQYRQHRPDRPLLYLVGDKRRDSIQSALDSAGIPLDELQVYSTHPRDDFRPDFDRALEAALARFPSVWLALFSPSGADLAIPVLKSRNLLDRVKLAAIGPTTRDALADRHGLTVCAMAARPEPDELVRSLRATIPLHAFPRSFVPSSSPAAARMRSLFRSLSLSRRNVTDVSFGAAFLFACLTVSLVSGSAVDELI